MALRAWQLDLAKNWQYLPELQINNFQQIISNRFSEQTTHFEIVAAAGKFYYRFKFISVP